jgi:thioredoxin-related protein
MTWLPRFLLLCSALCSVALPAHAWIEDVELALAQAKETERPVLVAVIGTDWNEVSRAMEREVLQQNEFLSWARERFVLLRIDWLRCSDLPAERARSYGAFIESHRIDRFPTFIVLDHQGRQILRTHGYMRGGIGAFRNWVKNSL